MRGYVIRTVILLESRVQATSQKGMLPSHEGSRPRREYRRPRHGAIPGRTYAVELSVYRLGWGRRDRSGRMPCLTADFPPIPFEFAACAHESIPREQPSQICNSVKGSLSAQRTNLDVVRVCVRVTEKTGENVCVLDTLACACTHVG